MSRPINQRPVYLVDFSVYKPPEELKLDVAAAESHERAAWHVSALRR